MSQPRKRKWWTRSTWMSEWLNLMLAEVTRKKEEEKAAQEEAARRKDSSSKDEQLARQKNT